MSAVSDIAAARLERWQREVNKTTIREMQVHIKKVETCLRQLLVLLKYDQRISQERLEAAWELVK